jgi:hypothetical protein
MGQSANRQNVRNAGQAEMISNGYSVDIHKWGSEEAGILIGTNTALWIIPGNGPFMGGKIQFVL